MLRLVMPQTVTIVVDILAWGVFHAATGYAAHRLGDDRHPRGAGDAAAWHRVGDRQRRAAHRIARLCVRIGGVAHTREIFASHPDQVTVVRMAVDRPGALDFSARLGSVHLTAVSGPRDARTLEMTGQVPGFALRRELE